MGVKKIKNNCRYRSKVVDVHQLINYLYNRSVVTPNQASELLNISHQSASSLIKKLVEDGVLEEYTGYQRNRAYIFKKYLQLFID